MTGTLNWVVGGIVAAVGIIGLFLAANAADGGFYLFGLALAGFSVVYIRALIKQGYDRPESRRRSADAET